MICALLLALAPQTDLEEAQKVRTEAWELHLGELDASALTARYEKRMPPRPEHWLRATARGVLDPEALAPLLELAFDDVDPEQPPGEALLELMSKAALTAKSEARLRELLQAPLWREQATLCLLRNGASPEVLDGFSPLLESAMLSGWRPQGVRVAEFFAREEFRPSLWPAFVGTSITAEELTALQRLEADAWSKTDQFLLALVIADQSLPTPESALLVWEAWHQLSFSSNAANALQAALQRHLPWIEESALQESLASMDVTRRHLAHDLLAQIAPQGAARVLRDVALHQEDTDRRARCASAVFRCGSDADVQALSALLQSNTPQDLLLAVLAGMRYRPAAEIGGLLEPMMPRLRTRPAVLAVELMVLYGNQELRSRWLDKLNALPISDQLRIVSAACTVTDREWMLNWAMEQARSDQEAAAQRGRAALAELMTPSEVAAQYRGWIEASTDPNERQRLLFAVRELRTDEALEVLIDWLSTEEGRQHGTSLQWAALMIEEDAAERAFQAWWDLGDGIDPTLRQVAAAHLAKKPGASRDWMWEQFGNLPESLATRFLIRVAAEATADDANRAITIFLSDLAPPLQRRSAASILGSASAAAPDAFNLALQSMPAAASVEAQPSAPWRTLVREAIVARPEDSEFRAELTRASLDLPLQWQLAMQTDIALADAQVDDAAARDRAMDRILQAIYDEPGSEHVDSRAAESELRMRHPGLFASISQLASVPDDEGDWSALQIAFELPQTPGVSTPVLHADTIAIMARGFEEDSAIGSLTREWLLAVESEASWRRPPQGSHPHRLPLTHWTDAPALFSELQDRFEAGETGGAMEALAAAEKRWPRDRRVHLWRGWFHLLRAEWPAAQRAFTTAKRVSGWLPYATLEPRLGQQLAVALLADQPLTDLEAFLNSESQGRALLRGRSIHGAWPKLDALLDDGD